MREVTPRPTSLAVIGGGIAGASLARAARAEGLDVTVIDDPDSIAASGNPAALVTPALDAGGETVLTLISDDNFSMIQRTLLLQFTLAEP